MSTTQFAKRVALELVLLFHADHPPLEKNRAQLWLSVMNLDFFMKFKLLIEEFSKLKLKLCFNEKNSS